MIFRTVKTEGLAHLSYLIGDGGKAAVIDPRRDCECYIAMAREVEMEIAYIFETHRNEDILSGAAILARETGAPVFHGADPSSSVCYAQVAREGDRFTIGGDLEISVLETPGHTDDHLCYVIHDAGYPDGAVGVFTGDALFVGDVGRTDFYPDRAAEVAGLLFDSLQKLKALGDQALIYPAHGAGSVCGSAMASREFSTIGHERCNNPRLKITDRQDFIAAKLGETHYLPPYFATMERLNLEGASAMPTVPMPEILPVDAIDTDPASKLVDIRSVSAFAAAHVPGALSLPVAMIPSFAGWFLEENDSILLIADNVAQAAQAATHLRRIGFDRIAGVVTNMVAIAAKGKAFMSIPFVNNETVRQRLAGAKPNWKLLDVRAADEVAAEPMHGATHLYIGQLRDRYPELDPCQPLTVMCASGARATVAAGWLQARGLKEIDIFLGSMGAWQQSPEKREPPVKEPPAKAPPVEQPPIKQPPIEEPPNGEPPIEQPPVEQPPVEKPPAEDHPQGDLSRI